MKHARTSSVLPPAFFRRPVAAVARDLLGKVLVRCINGEHIRSVICEVEAYDGMCDRACHACKGKTPRTAPMFAAGGIFYVYFVYGMHWMLNIVTSDVGYPAAVLIRGVRGIAGPGRLTKALRITGALNGKAATERSGLWIEEGGIKVATRAVRRLPRIGVAYAGAWAKKPYRFLWECDA